MGSTSTIDETSSKQETRERPEVGLLVAFPRPNAATNDDAPCRTIALRHGKVVLGRDEPTMPDDDRLSRRHAEVAWDGVRWSVRDLGSRNGTYVDGERVEGSVRAETVRVVRVGRTLLVPVPDVRAFAGTHVRIVDGLVLGPTMLRALNRIGDIARSGDALLITGETGSGKERAAGAFHTRGPSARGPMVTVNCAAIPEGLAERLLFGARKGAFSGAENSEGWVRAADGGVLFLDEIGELDLDVQAKLLRVIETGETVPLGATAPQRVDVRLCFATHRDLRAAVADGTFREDLYHRIAQPTVRVPPLRDRPEEIPTLVARSIAAVDPKLAVHMSLVEACLARAWPGNVRELLHHTRAAAHAARAEPTDAVTREHLAPEAGVAIEAKVATDPRPSRDRVENALRDENGNIAAAARVLGLHRTQLYRLLKRFGISAPRET